MKERYADAGISARRFSCTSCGKCCDSGPEMELSEATVLADKFVTSIIFKVHSLPIDERSTWAVRWWQNEKSRIPLRAALEEKRRHLSYFASRKSIEKQRERHCYLTISAMANDYGKGRCPNLSEGRCSIYDARPLTCRTVPLHYSRPASSLAGYLSGFTSTPGYRCDTTPAAPVILDGRTIVDPKVQQARDEALKLARVDRAWKDGLLLLMDDAHAAGMARLPTYNAVFENSDNGYATTLPMIVAWRVLRNQGSMTTNAFGEVCQKQADLIRNEIASGPDAALTRELVDTLALYEHELSALRRPTPGGNSLSMAARGR